MRILWSPGKVLDDLYVEFTEHGLSGVKYTYIDERLSGAARRHHGTYAAAVDMMFKQHGLEHTHEDVNNAPTKRREEYDNKAFEWLHERWKNGDDLDLSALSRADNPCIHTLIRGTRYKSMGGVITELKRRYPDVDVTYEEIKENAMRRQYDAMTKWSLDMIKEGILAHHNKGVELGDLHYLSYTNMREIDPDLVDVASSSYLKSWEKSVMATSDEFGLGLDYTEIRKDKKFDKKKIGARIREIGARDPMLLLEPEIKAIDNGLFVGARRPWNYGGWVNAVEANGFNYNQLRKKRVKEKQEEKREEIRDRIFGHFKKGVKLDRLIVLDIDSPLVHLASSKLYFHGSWYEAVGDSLRRNLGHVMRSGRYSSAADELLNAFRIRRQRDWLNYGLLALYRGDGDIG